MKHRSAIAVALMVAAASLGPTLSAMSGETHMSDPHKPARRSKGEKARNRKFHRH